MWGVRGGSSRKYSPQRTSGWEAMMALPMAVVAACEARPADLALGGFAELHESVAEVVAMAGDEQKAVVDEDGGKTVDRALG